jgi:hypothetical protein
MIKFWRSTCGCSFWSLAWKSSWMEVWIKIFFSCTVGTPGELYVFKYPSPTGSTKKAVLRIRIRDRVPFRPLDPGFGMGKKSRFGIRDDHIPSTVADTDPNPDPYVYGPPGSRTRSIFFVRGIYPDPDPSIKQ